MRLLYCVCVCATLICVGAVDNKDGQVDEDQLVIKQLNTLECSRRSKKGDVIQVHYTGTLTDGKKFDSSFGREPLKFTVGSGQVIKGWDEGMLDMCVGDERKLTIPPSKGYGSQGAGESIPPDATLVFEVKLVTIGGEEGMEGDEGLDGNEQDVYESPDAFFTQLDTNKDNEISKDEFGVYIREQGGNPDDETSNGATDPDAMAETIFAQEDKNKDGVITREEFLSDKHDEL